MTQPGSVRVVICFAVEPTGMVFTGVLVPEQ